MTATSKLKKEHQEFGIILGALGDCEMAKKEFLLMTFPDTMKYNQLVQNLRTKDNYTYSDVVANLKAYVPQLIWKKRGDDRPNRDTQGRTQGTGSKDSPITINRNAQQLTDRFGKPLDMSKTCGYCQNVKKWRGIGHTEAECKTKQREKGTGNAGTPAAKPAKLDFDDSADEGVPVKRLFVRMIKAANST